MSQKLSSAAVVIGALRVNFNFNLFVQSVDGLTIFTRPANTCTCPLKVYAIKNIRELGVRCGT